MLLTWLAEHHGGARPAEVEGALLPLLEDFSDDVRIGAVRVLSALAPGDARPRGDSSSSSCATGTTPGCAARSWRRWRAWAPT